MLKTNQQRAFTLVELLVVIAIIGILASFLMSALASPRITAYKASCKNSEKQIGIDILSYAADFEGYAPPNALDGVGHPS